MTRDAYLREDTETKRSRKDQMNYQKNLHKSLNNFYQNKAKSNITLNFTEKMEKNKSMKEENEDMVSHFTFLIF